MANICVLVSVPTNIRSPIRAQVRLGNSKDTRGTAYVVYDDIWDAKTAQVTVDELWGGRACKLSRRAAELYTASCCICTGSKV